MTMRILLVEDYPTTCKGICGLLATAGHAVDVSPTADEADLKLQANDYELAVIDYVLSDGDGLGLLRNMRARGDRTPVILMTAIDGELADELRTKAIAEGALFLRKPFEPEQLLGMVEGKT
jgi:DNA-binding response OmpR family regulator